MNKHDDIFWQLLHDSDGATYTENRGWGYVPWVSGCFIAVNSMPLSYTDMKKNNALNIISEEWFEFLFDSVTECDMLLFKLANTGNNKIS